MDDQWRFVTGAPAAITALARDGFHLGVAEGESREEPITHSVRLVLIDARGAIRGYYDATDAQAIRRLQSDARRLARSKGNSLEPSTLNEVILVKR